MDNGPEMTSDLFVRWAQEQGIELRFIQPGKPNQNAYVERFNKSLRTEVLNAWLFHSLEQAQEVIEDWREDYNGIRGHKSLGNRPVTIMAISSECLTKYSALIISKNLWPISTPRK